MTETIHAEGIDNQNTTKVTIKERIIVIFMTIGKGENIKIIIKTNIGMKMSMIVIDLMIQIILMVEIGHMTETGHIVQTGKSPQEYK